MTSTSDASFADTLLTELKAWESCKEQLLSTHSVPAHNPLFATIEPSLLPYLPQEIQNIYHHQALTVEKALRGEHLTLATATASGKTLALALPSRLRRVQQQNSTLLCIAPTRALVEQWAIQLRRWDASVRVETYTGDTPKEKRTKMKDVVQCLVITPDMLHMGLLPYHYTWKRFLSQLRDVIIDESHIYCGVFGSHMTHILRRLERVVRFYRKDGPVFLLASATIGNPAEHATQLVGSPVGAITENGAPSGGRRIALWQPPDDRGHGDEAAGLMAFFLLRGVRTILFGQARQSVERMLRVVRSHLPASYHHLVEAYRAGYMVEERHVMQQKLAAGALLGVVSTNALELGIDIGHLDVSILDGFPGSIASFWQQAGRAGRRERSALTIFVLREDALDQYFALHPEKLIDRPAERALVNESNPYILPRHLLCAAYEFSLAPGELSLFGQEAQTSMDHLVEEGSIVKRSGRYYLADRTNSPAYTVPLRQAGQRFALISQGHKLEETDLSHAVTECFPGAVYFSQGHSYVVQRLDLEDRSIYLNPEETHYYTEPFVDTDVTILLTRTRTMRLQAQLHVGDVVIMRQVTGYMKRHQQYRSALEKIELSEPLEVPLETKAFWITIDESVIEKLVEHHVDPAGSLHAAEHAMIALLPLFVLGDRRDVGGVSVVPFHEQTGKATIFIYDGHEGGIGYAEEAYRQFEALAKATLEALLVCKCLGGCHACVMSPKCGNQNRPLDKAGAILLLQMLLRDAKGSEAI